MFAQAVVDGMAVVANVSPLWLVYRLLRSTQQTWPSVWQRIVSGGGVRGVHVRIQVARGGVGVRGEIGPAP